MPKKYFDLHVTTSHSFGTNSVEEMVKQAEKLNLDTICIADHIETEKDLEKIKNEISSLNTKMNVLLGAEIKADKVSDLQSKIKKFRELVDILLVSGGNITINRAAASDSRVDILAHPEYKRKDSGMDHIIMKLAAQNQVAIELNFREYLHAYKKIRSFILSNMQRNVMLAENLGAPIVVTSAAESIWDLRAGRELASLAYLVGLDIAYAIKTVTETPQNIINGIEKIKSPKFVRPGVEIK